MRYNPCNKCQFTADRKCGECVYNQTAAKEIQIWGIIKDNRTLVDDKIILDEIIKILEKPKCEHITNELLIKTMS